MGSANGNTPSEEPMHINPLPLPLAWQIGLSEVGPEKFIVLQVQTPAGTNLYWMDVDNAITLGRKITQFAQSHKFGGLTIASEGEVPNLLKGWPNIGN